MIQEALSAERQLIREVFSEEDALGMPDFDESITLKIGGRVVGHVGLSVQRIGVGNKELTVVGIGYVATAAEFRRRGIMMGLMHTSLDHAALDLGCEFALLATDQPHLYAPIGFHSARNLNEESMVLELMASMPWPLGPVTKKDRGRWAQPSLG